MATSSISGGTHIPEEASGKDIRALGPSDNSDSGSDVQGAYGDDEMSSDSDAVGTGERATAGTGMDNTDADILPDHIESDAGGGIEETAGLDSVESLAVDEDDSIEGV